MDILTFSVSLLSRLLNKKTQRQIVLYIFTVAFHEIVELLCIWNHELKIVPKILNCFDMIFIFKYEDFGWNLNRIIIKLVTLTKG